MIEVGNTIVSFDVLTKEFVCDLDICRGECCIEGESGAPVAPDEIDKLKELVPIVWDDLSEVSKAVIKEQGPTYTDEDGDEVTSIVNGRECVFTYTDSDGICKCAIEKAFREGKTDFYKPISCHLYPIRLTEMDGLTLLNYHKWRICRCACDLGHKQKVPVYKFLKEPLIRRFGTEWYEELEMTVEELKKQKMI